jgi:hypothetical protein
VPLLVLVLLPLVETGSLASVRMDF